MRKLKRNKERLNHRNHRHVNHERERKRKNHTCVLSQCFRIYVVVNNNNKKIESTANSWIAKP